MKWPTNVRKYRETNLEESRVVLREHCETSLKKLPYDLRIAALLEFGTATKQVRTPFCLHKHILRNLIFQSDILCERVERNVAQTLSQSLTQILDNVCDGFQKHCIELASKSDHPITEQTLHETLKKAELFFDNVVTKELERVRSD
jgi:hypothetical protein